MVSRTSCFKYEVFLILSGGKHFLFPVFSIFYFYSIKAKLDCLGQSYFYFVLLVFLVFISMFIHHIRIPWFSVLLRLPYDGQLHSMARSLSWSHFLCQILSKILRFSRHGYQPYLLILAENEF